jgi:hypothetical protein
LGVDHNLVPLPGDTFNDCVIARSGLAATEDRYSEILLEIQFCQSVYCFLADKAIQLAYLLLVGNENCTRRAGILAVIKQFNRFEGQPSWLGPTGRYDSEDNRERQT